MLIIILAYLKLVNLFSRCNKNDRGIYNGNVRSWTSNLGWYPFLSEREEIEKNFKLKMFLLTYVFSPKQNRQTVNKPRTETTLTASCIACQQ